MWSVLGAVALAVTLSSCSSDNSDVPLKTANSSSAPSLDLDAAQAGLLRAIAGTPEDTSDEQSSKVPCPFGSGRDLLTAAGLPSTVGTTFSGSEKEPPSVGCGFTIGSGTAQVIAARATFSELPNSDDLRVEKPLYGGDLRLKESAPDPSATAGTNDAEGRCSAVWSVSGRRLTLVLNLQGIDGADETACGPSLEKLIPVVVAKLADYR